MKYGCHPAGGCNYLAEGDSYPYEGFCTFKEVVQEWDCLEFGAVFKVNQWRGGSIIWTGDVRVFPESSVSAYGRRDPLASGAFQNGDELTPWTADTPTTSPSANPSSSPTIPPTPLPTVSFSNRRLPLTTIAFSQFI